MSDSLFSEVDADVRAERLAQLWARYRRPLFVSILLVLVVTAGHSVWRYQVEKQGGARLAALVAAQDLLKQHKAEEAAAGFAAVAQQSHGDDKTLAEIWQARALLAADKKDEAIAVLKPASARSVSLWSDIACLRLASLDPSAECLGKANDSPLIGPRHEWQAANLWAAGNHKQSIALLEELETSPDTNDATRARVSQLLATLRSEQAGQ